MASSSFDSEGPCAPCNVCGGLDFSRGPSERLSATQRLPHCNGCHSLERHRVARRVFERLTPQYTAGKRMLQFSDDPGVDKTWFSEHMLSVWQGKNSLDVQAIDLPSGRFDWIYSSHVLNHVPDDAAALREMVRVVGAAGVVALSVGGTVFTYKTRPSRSSLGRDYQYRLYGTEFADDISNAVPDVAVLELVLSDPSTASIDSFYLCSRSEERLREMAQAAVSGNIHARVFPAREIRRAEATTVQTCSICQGTEFTFGPGQRRSSPHGLLPGCRQCGSLERHRTVHRALSLLAPRFTKEAKLLQLDNNPGISGEWFSEVVVSPRATDASIGVNDTGLAAGRYDWVCAVHLIHERSDDRGPLRELVKLVGANGVVVLSLRGSVASYQAVMKLDGPEDLVAARDEHGTTFIDEAQTLFPGLAALELVTSDPATGTVDVVHLLSFDEDKLQQMFSVFTDQGVYARFFRSTRAKPTQRPASLVDWDKLRREIELWRASGQRARFWLRDDDAGAYTPELAALVDTCVELDLPIALAVIPERLSSDLVGAVAQNERISVLQHGFDHKNRSSTKQPSEFPDTRPLSESLDAVRRGWATIGEQFGAQALPVFVPPWGESSPELVKHLSQVGMIGYSGSQVGPFRPVDQCRRGGPTTKEGLKLASTHLAINRARPEETAVLPKVRNLSFLTRLVGGIRGSTDGDEPIGIMTHAWGVDAEVRDFLRELVEVTRGAGAEWVRADELFQKD